MAQKNFYSFSYVFGALPLPTVPLQHLAFRSTSFF